MSSLKRFVVPFLALVVVIGSMFLIVIIQKQSDDDERRQDEVRQKINQLEQIFQQDIERAKRATGDPCATVFYEVVTPPTGTGMIPRLVVMGQVLPYNDSSSLSFYFLKPNGDKVELWERVMNRAEYGPKKIGEKFAPDSPRCRGR